VNDAGGEARVALGVAYFNPELALDGIALSHEVHGRVAHGLAGEGGHFAGHADDRSGARKARQDRDLQHHVAEVVGQWRPHRRVVRQDQDALVVFAQPQLFLAAHHRIIFDAAQRRFLEHHDRFAGLVAVVEVRAAQGQHHLLPSVAGADVGRAGDHGDRLSCAVVPPWRAAGDLRSGVASPPKSGRRRSCRDPRAVRCPASRRIRCIRLPGRPGSASPPVARPAG
jgi:hypothetical protein